MSLERIELDFIEDSLRVLERLCEAQLAEQIRSKEVLGAIHECLKEIVELLKAQ
jgi:hypothetical protein